MDRVFLEANVLFSAAFRDGAGVTRLWKVERAALVTSDYALEEARRNLDTSEQLERLDELMPELERVPSVSLDPDLRATVDLREKDWPILGAAVACGASHLITGDHRDFGQYFGTEVMGVLVLTPAQYLKQAMGGCPARRLVTAGGLWPGASPMSSAGRTKRCVPDAVP